MLKVTNGMNGNEPGYVQFRSWDALHVVTSQAIGGPEDVHTQLHQQGRHGLHSRPLRPHTSLVGEEEVVATDAGMGLQKKKKKWLIFFKN